MPQPEDNGFIKTMNNMGYMTSSLDHVQQAFVEFSTLQSKPVLDIGAAYGIASIEAAKLGATVIANDIDERHLEVLLQRTPSEARSNITLLPGAFPDLNIQPSSVASILIARVLHFFSGPELIDISYKLFDWLSPNGKVFITAETPYLGNFSEFLPTYEKRIENGASWPGYIEDVLAIAPERGKSLPKTMHLLDPTVLSRTFVDAGFTIDECATFARPEFPKDLQLDGRESVGLIACKKS